MKKMIFLVLTLLIWGSAGMNAQVRIGGETGPVTGAVLDLNSTDDNDANTQGLALPRVALQATTNVTLPIADPVKGMLVYNTATAGDVTPGVYYSDGTKWVSAADATATTNTCPGTVNGVTPGNVYKVGNFGAAGCWTIENLRDSTGTDASRNPNVPTTGNYEIKAYWYPNGDSNTASGLGLLYTWAAATGRTGVATNEGNTDQTNTQGICPSGWHIPSDMEWMDLEKVLATQNNITWDESYRTTISTAFGLGTIMKAATIVYPFAQNIRPTGGTSYAGNIYEFNSMLVGIINDGAPDGYGAHTLYWSSSSHTPSTAWRQMMSITNGGVARAVGIKSCLYAVRCKKD